MCVRTIVSVYGIITESIENVKQEDVGKIYFKKSYFLKGNWADESVVGFVKRFGHSNVKVRIARGDSEFSEIHVD